MDLHQQPSRHRQRDNRKKEILNPKPQSTDGAGRTKLPTKTGTFWSWVSAPGEVLSLPQETVWEVEACLQKLPGCTVWYLAVAALSWRRRQGDLPHLYKRAQNTPAGHVNARCRLHHKMLYKLEGCHAKEGRFFATWKIPVSPGSCREKHHPSRHDQQCRRGHIIIARRG